MADLRETIPLKKSKIIKRSICGIGSVILSIAFLWFVLKIVALNSPDQSIADNPLIVFGIGRSLGVFILKYASLILGSFFIAILIYQYFYLHEYFYNVDDKNIIIRKGVLAKKEITLPFSRITDVYVDQDIVDVLFGLYDVHISTPTQQSGVFAHIDGVNKEGSHKLRQIILDRINKG